MHEIYFLARHTPFWAIPILILSAEFGYVFWLKKKRKTAVFCMSIAFIALSSSIFYYWAGGPEKSVKFIKELQRNYR